MNVKKQTLVKFLMESQSISQSANPHEQHINLDSKVGEPTFYIPMERFREAFSEFWASLTEAQRTEIQEAASDA